MSSKLSRRHVFQAAAAAGLMPAAAAAPAKSETDNVYTRIGVRPFINMTATYTINGGAPMLPEVKQAMEDASQWAVNLDELMEKAGARVAELLQAESAIISCGCAAALAQATAACVAGGDPEKMKRLPDTTGMRNEVLIARQSRNDYDHAYRIPGAKLVEYDTREQFFAALGHRTALVVVLGTGEAAGKMRLEEIAEAAHKLNVPVIVDAAAELPLRPNPFLSRGADLVAYSGGKIMRGPQSAGMLLGRKDLVRAAWWNAAPHHALGRAMKVSKEEIVGMVTAVEMFVGKRNLESEYETWRTWYKAISEEITKIPGVTTKMVPPKGASPFPVMDVSWDPKLVPIMGEAVHEKLLNGEPRIMSHAGGEATNFVIRAVAMRPEHPPIVGKRLSQIFREAAQSREPAPPSSPSMNLSGTWEMDLQFVSGRANHTLVFDATSGSRLKGLHVGSQAKGRISGKTDGGKIQFQSTLTVEGMRLNYRFTGTIQGDQLAGEVELAEFGKAKWVAKRMA